MPRSWKETTLGKVLAPKGYIRGPFGSALRRNELLDAGIPVYEQQHAIYGIRDFRFFISGEKYKEMQRFGTKPNDLIISCSGTLGKVSIIKEDDPNGIISQAILLLRVNTDLILPQYLQYFFSSKEGYNAILARSNGSVQVNISKRADIEKIPLMLPSIDEQKEIVETLGVLDAKIANNSKINHHLEQIGRAIFNSWFVDFEPWDGEQPSDWLEKSLEEFINFQEGPGIRNWQYVPQNGTKFINIRCIQDGDLRLDTANMIASEEAGGKYSHFMLNEWDVVVSTSGTLGRNAVVRKEHLPLCLNTSVIRFAPKQSFSHFSYMLGYLTSHEFYDHLQTKASGSVQVNFGPMHLRQITMLVPSDIVLEKYHHLVFPLIQKVIENRRESEKLAELRNSLMPYLMSGEISVTDIGEAK